MQREVQEVLLLATETALCWETNTAEIGIEAKMAHVIKITTKNYVPLVQETTNTCYTNTYTCTLLISEI
jgi:hypothetical protein